MAKKKEALPPAEYTVQLLIAKPVAVKPTVKDGELGEYQTAEGETLLWSGEKRLPAVGKEVFLWLHQIGLSTVRGYWRKGKHLGVMVECLREGGAMAYHVFGSEIGDPLGSEDPGKEPKRAPRVKPRRKASKAAPKARSGKQKRVR